MDKPIPNPICMELARIAHQVLDIPTLEARMHDRLDFHEVAVWTLKKALYAAYLLGKSDDR